MEWEGSEDIYRKLDDSCTFDVERKKGRMGEEGRSKEGFWFFVFIEMRETSILNLLGKDPVESVRLLL